MSDKIFFSLGPVQGFVAQARRTRDLWSGSFLLSYLSGCAISEVMDKGGQITIPDVTDDPLLAWIRRSREGNAPIIGSIPNRFEAIVEDDPKSVASSAAKMVQNRWMEIAEAVWDEYVVDVAENGYGTEMIWDRQVKNFWEINWVAAPDISSMNSRKNWRIIGHLEEEPGDHCTMMGDWQELSGFVRSKQSRIQNKFWESLSFQRINGKRKLGKLDIREGERLCALALIKRLFPVSTMAKDWGVETRNWPSTPYVAAIPWLKSVIDAASEDAYDYAGHILNAASGAERKGISRQIGSFCDRHNRFLDLDGNFYFENALIDCKRTPFDDTPEFLKNCAEEPDEDKKTRKELKIQLRALSEKAKFRPTPFYAMLLMDGDNMGKLMGDYKDKEDLITKALSAFTKDVRDIVKTREGVTIYAGGDDVLAMLPMPEALKCAKELSESYEKRFEDVIPEVKATISAGLVFSHYHIPLSTVMREAHYILDDVAKDKNGRGSIAVSVLKNSGKYCQWTVTWDRLTDEESRDRIDDLVFKVREGPHKKFSKSFFYGMRDDLAILSGDQSLKPGNYANLIEGLDPLPLLTAEYMKSRDRKVSREDAEKQVGSLLELSYKSHNKSGVNKTVLSTDAAMLIKFLSQTAEGGSE
ncbi:type III-B CRISPR-associated protein Cas10/Cmr2 [Methanothrix harundinacea]|uniref:type III-B CRISPR-associated protein Cas10/Cmr2 n=1 Tax=Methanothrix harundinacea TaxID=301375 RepID=UPI00064E655A|nr:type III-B CRISPR-associated protein Cas10/Cmr2 [Methanothrix harundinacea]